MEDGVVDPTPEVKLPAVYQINQYSTFGEKTTLTYPDSQYKINELPSPYSLANWNSITYSTKEIDTETGEYHYGSRNYNPGIASWNQQDTYRGETTDPSTRHRYIFVNDNPLNSVDEYGYCDIYSQVCSDPYSAMGDVKSQKALNTSIKTELLTAYVSGTIKKILLPNKIKTHNSIQNEISRRATSAYSYLTKTRHAAFVAKMNMYDYVLMNGVINRLAARGYSMEYTQVYSYLGNQINKTAKIYQTKNSQYLSAQTKYNYYADLKKRAQSLGEDLSSDLSLLLKSLPELKAQLKSANEISKYLQNAGDYYMGQIQLRYDRNRHNIISKQAQDYFGKFNVGGIGNGIIGTGGRINFSGARLVLTGAYGASNGIVGNAILRTIDPKLLEQKNQFTGLLYKETIFTMDAMEEGFLYGLDLDPYRRTNDTGVKKYGCSVFEGTCNLKENISGEYKPNTSQLTYDILNSGIEIFSLYELTKGISNLGKSVSKSSDDLTKIGANSSDDVGKVVVKKSAIPDVIPDDLTEQLILEEARSSRGKIIIENLGDENRLIANYGKGEWVKKEFIRELSDGRKYVVHWHENLATGQKVEFKFK